MNPKNIRTKQFEKGYKSGFVYEPYIENLEIDKRELEKKFEQEQQKREKFEMRYGHPLFIERNTSGDISNKEYGVWDEDDIIAVFPTRKQAEKFAMNEWVKRRFKEPKSTE